ncbi:GIY-YIG nuclease family protein [Streptomyces sp. NPDC046859]|uniref:GIY-YIG nuclease family protein n=1 Tax=Streptomyces sp. NPDC046859 TaxID=3155734 RepID=UPI0033DE1C15
MASDHSTPIRQSAVVARRRGHAGTARAQACPSDRKATVNGSTIPLPRGVTPERIRAAQTLSTPASAVASQRVRYHYRGNAAGSTLRLTLGCLLGLELRRVGSGKRMTFGKAGEATLTQWMADNARVCWIEQDEPWALESKLISRLDLPLNLDQNRHNAFHSRLKELRAQARQRARDLPVGA